MKINLDYLHKNYLNKSGRYSGRTTDMLVNAIQHADFASNIAIILKNKKQLETIFEQFKKIVKNMGYQIKVFSRIPYHFCIINKCRFYFFTHLDLQSDKTLGLVVDNVFQDHEDIENNGCFIEEYMLLNPISEFEEPTFKDFKKYVLGEWVDE